MTTDRGRYPAGTLEVRGRDFPVTVCQGRFSAGFEGRDWTSDTLEGLRTLLMRATATSAAKISVPFCYMTGQQGQLRVREAEVTGIHGATGNLMIRWDPREGAKQWTGHLSSTTYMRPLDDAERAEWVRLAQAVLDAQKAQSAFTEAHALKLQSAAAAAVADALAAKDGQS